MSFFNRLWYGPTKEPVEEVMGYHINRGEDYKIDKSSKVYKITRMSDKRVFAMKTFEKQEMV
jgi:hypothetical protein